MKRSEFARIYGGEAASIAEGSGAKFEPEASPSLRLAVAEFWHNEGVRVALMAAVSPPILASREVPLRSLTAREADLVTAWWNARSLIERIFEPIAKSMAPDGSPSGRFERAVQAALYASKES